MLTISPNPEPSGGPFIQPSPTSAIARYTDAYRVARVLTTIGTVIKVLSMAIGGLIITASLISGFVSATSPPTLFGPTASLLGLGTSFFGAIFGFLIGTIGIIVGVMISAQGQLVLAALDGAVNTSPFLSIEDKARMMSL